MRAKPIIFSGPMVRALLEGRKTQTRRAVKPLTKRHPILNLAEHGVDRRRRNYSGRHNDPASWGFAGVEDGVDMALADWPELCPYGGPGSLLWVRETFIHDPATYVWEASVSVPAVPASTTYRADYGEQDARMGRWSSPIHMPRDLSRLTLRITDVRVRRLQEISNEDAVAEGIGTPTDMRYAAQDGFRPLWERINGEGSWDANPWVWALTFDVIKANVDDVASRESA